MLSIFTKIFSSSAIQFGLWDASSPSGTAQWAMGPINVSLFFVRVILLALD